MKRSYELEDTEQTKKMKELALDGAYFNCGEIYKLLSNKELHHLVKKIKKGSIKLKSNLVYGKMEITKEEKFLENLDHYITYVKNTYHIDCIEQLLLLEMGLDNKYAEKCLLSLKDFHDEENYNEYFNYFRRMFLFNIFNNIQYYHFEDEGSEAINRAYNELDKYDFNSDNDILFIERMFIDVFKARDNNLFNAFDSHKKIRNNEQLPFYITQLEWVLSDYYNYIDKGVYDIKSSDNVFEKENTKILFNICSNYKECNDNDYIMLEFGVFNDEVSSKTKNIPIKKEEFNIVYEMLADIVNEDKQYKEIISFVDTTLKFDFDFAGKSDTYLDIIYELPGCSGDFYDVSMGEKDIINLYNIIIKQIKE